MVAFIFGFIVGAAAGYTYRNKELVDEKREIKGVELRQTRGIDRGGDSNR